MLVYWNDLFKESLRAAALEILEILTNISVICGEGAHLGLCRLSMMELLAK